LIIDNYKLEIVAHLNNPNRTEQLGVIN